MNRERGAFEGRRHGLPLKTGFCTFFVRVFTERLRGQNNCAVLINIHAHTEPQSLIPCISSCLRGGHRRNMKFRGKSTALRSPPPPNPPHYSVGLLGLQLSSFTIASALRTPQTAVSAGLAEQNVLCSCFGLMSHGGSTAYLIRPDGFNTTLSCTLSLLFGCFLCTKTDRHTYQTSQVRP